MFKITPQAAEQIQQAAKQGGTEGLPLRFAASVNADGTYEYLMGFDAAKEDDIQYDSEGIAIIMQPEQAPLLDETVMDYAELDNGEKNFIFINPKDANYSPRAN